MALKCGGEIGARGLCLWGGGTGCVGRRGGLRGGSRRGRLTFLLLVFEDEEAGEWMGYMYLILEP